MNPRAEAAFFVFSEIGIINQLATRAFESVLPAGLTLPLFSVLNHLVRLEGDWTPARLARAFQVARPTMTHTLQRLEAAGLVKIKPDPRDRRGKLVVITRAGTAMHDHARAAVAPQLAAIGKALPFELFAKLLPPLAELRDYMDSARD